MAEYDDWASDDIVERIDNERLRNNQIEYLVKWKNLSEDEKTWEPKEKLDCPDLIAEYKFKKNPPSPESSELKRNLEPEEIIGATVDKNIIWLLTKFKNSDVASLISNSEMKAKHPELLFRFYEERFVAVSSENSSSQPGPSSSHSDARSYHPYARTSHTDRTASRSHHKSSHHSKK